MHLLSLWHVPAEHHSLHEVWQTLDAHLLHSAGTEWQSQVHLLVSRVSIIETASAEGGGGNVFDLRLPGGGP
jgi:hypothetical protein